MNLFVILSIGFLPTLASTSRILVVVGTPSFSHQKPFCKLAKELSLRGHDVTFITTNPVKDNTLTNLTEIDISFLYKFLQDKGGFSNMLSSQKSIYGAIIELEDFLSFIGEHILRHGDVQRLFSGKKFDLLLIEPLNRLLLAFEPVFKAPLIAMSTSGVFMDSHNAMGNPNHPILASDKFLVNTGSAELPFFQRLEALFYNVWFRAIYRWKFVPEKDEIARKHFGNDFPSIAEIQSRISLLMVTSNPIIDSVRPNVPTVVHLEMLHIDKPKPLPKDILDFLESSPRDVVYFSLGSNVKSSGLNNKTLGIIKNALGSLPYNVLWKFEVDDLPEKPQNVMIKKWLPQQDVLGHPKIKVFVTQGGLQSIEEAISKGVPMVALPFLGDQPKNVLKLEKWKIGKRVDPFQMTEDQLRQAIIEVAVNPSFKQNLEKARNIIEDQPLTGVSKAIWWVEYVLRHNGTEHLRYPAKDMTFYKYFMLDVILFLFAVLFIVMYCFSHLFLSVKGLFSSNKSKTE